MRTHRRTYERTHPWLTFRLDLRELPYDIWLLLGEARSKCEHVAGVPLRPDTAQQLHVVYLAKGVQATTAIEGNTLSEDEVRKQIERKLKLPRSKEYLAREVDNVLEALHAFWLGLVDEEPQPISVHSICDFNRQLLKGLSLGPDVVPGEIRSHTVGVAAYKGAPHEDCEFLLDRMCSWLVDIDRQLPASLGTASAILRAVVAHLYIAWIHPFGDGNGRTARLVEFAILSQAGLPQPAAHLLSNHYNQTRAEYYRQLDAASRSGGDIVPFLRYAIQGFVDGLAEQIERIREQQFDVVWRNYVHERFKEKPSPARQRQRTLILDLSRKDDPVPRRLLLTQVSARVAREYAGKTMKTVSRDVNALRAMDLIELAKGGFRAKKSVVEAFLPARVESARKATGVK